MIAAVTMTSAGSWTSSLWADVAATYDAILAHPFVRGLTSGELAEEAFAHYIAQDAHYLRDYARALAIVGAKASAPADIAMFARHAAGAVEVELSLHAGLLAELGLDPEVVESVAVAPTTRAYTSYLLATAYGGSFAEAVAAVLPCYWIYARVGAELATLGSPDPRYQRWISTYGGAEFTAVVQEVLNLTDRIGDSLGEDDRARARGHFVTTSRYEWMFWDAAWRREAWPRFGS